MATLLQLTLLGSITVKLGEGIVALETAKAKALLAYLALTDRPQRREHLVDLLWGEMAEAPARRNLTATLTSLRKELAAYLLHGVTTVRNLSGMPFHLRMAEAIESGALLGPRLYTSGPILNSLGPNQQINHQIVQTADEARAAVEAQHSAGFDRIKTYSNLTADAYAGALAAARKHGMRITGHTPEGERLAGIPSHRDFQISFAEVLGHGFETIEHAESIVFHGLRDRRDKQAGLALARRIADAGVPVTATLVAQRNLVRMAQTRGDFAKRDGTQWLNPVTQAMEAESIAFWSGQDPSSEAEKAEFYAWFTKAMHDAGVPIVAGADAGIFSNIPGASLHDELELLVEAGLTPAEAIDAATSGAAKALGEEGRLGCSNEGCAADLVMLACDPREDISCIRRTVAVVRNGRWYGPADLDVLRSRAADHDREQTIADLVEGMAAQGTPLDPAVLGS